jgi:MFS family permease
MVVLDTTITNVAMPTISGFLGVSTNEGTWIITAYAVAEAITVPLTGWLASQFGQVRVFVWSVAAFVFFSVCCGLSWSLTSLVVFRILQGLAGGPLIPLSATLLLLAFPRGKGNAALALWGMMTVVAPVIGPIMGGFISDNWSWQWSSTSTSASEPWWGAARGGRCAGARPPSSARAYGIFFGNVVLTPLWLQQWMGYTATWAGYVLAPMGVLAVVTSPIVGRLLPKVDPRWLVTFGMSMLIIAFVMRARMTTQADYSSVALPMFILGAGIPACVITLTSLGVSDLPAEKVAGGSGVQNFLRVLSMAIGSSLTQTYWDRMTRFNRAELVAATDPLAPAHAAAELAAANVPHDSAIAAFSRIVDSQSVMLATNAFYQVATVLMLGTIAVVWLIKRPRGPLRKVAGH